ncbi:MAG: phosphoribosylformylglycinamidine synthase subunit PurL [Candidatus Omnitrophica bacterium]|nr:phosphoribosylformylglycinamidine synthase subunit PurL [Candidatus Omnitrophota bacterium]
MFDAVRERLKKDIRDIGIRGVKDVEYIEVYTLRGSLARKEIARVAHDLLADKISQEAAFPGAFYSESTAGLHIIEIAYNPGVMDPVRESTQKAIEDMGIRGVAVSTSKKYAIMGKLTKRQLKAIADQLLYNKIIQHVVIEDEPSKELEPYHFQPVFVDVIDASDRMLKKLSLEGQLYLSLPEMKEIQSHFRKLGRNPSRCELETIAQTWSEHCKHKTMMGDILYNGKLIKNLLKDTVMRATRELKKPWCVSVFKDNAGIIEFDHGNNICFKVETHNHPSALEPYGGAETGIGGVLRDTMGTGCGAKPVANTDVFCFGIPDAPRSRIPKGALHPRRVMKGVVSGVRDYGNKMGIPTVNGAVCFDERYTGNPLVFCGNVGILPGKFSAKKVSPGELIVAVGGRTGRDGIHGATFSSAELTTESESISGAAVQIGNPITEKKIVDTLIKARDLGLYTALTDCGAGGFSSAVGEMGEKTGAEVHLERAPLKYEGLNPWEIWVSEAQERMVLAVKPTNLRRLMNVFESENVEAVVIGKFTSDRKLRVYYKKHKVADLDMSFLHDGLPRSVRKAVWKAKPENKKVPFRQEKDLTGALMKILASWNVCSKEWIIRQYDHEVQGGSVLKPLVGVKNDGPADASIVRPVLTSNKGIVIANGINPCYGDIDPYWMAAGAIDEALRQIAVVGGNLERTALLDNFCWGNTEKPRQLGGLVRAAEACYDMARVYGTPFISGKDSLNNEFNTGKGTVSIPPTLLISAVSVIDDARKTASSDMKAEGNLIYVLGKTHNELGASRYLLEKNIRTGVVPRVDPARSLKLMKRLSKAVRSGLIRSAHDCSDGGIAVCLAEMLVGGELGASVSLDAVPRGRSAERDDVLLFSESNSRFIVEISPEKKKTFEKTMKGIPAGLMGKVTGDGKLAVTGIHGKIVISAGVQKLKNAWKNPIGKVMHERS